MDKSCNQQIDYFNNNQLSITCKIHIKSQMEYCSPLWDRAGVRYRLMLLDAHHNPSRKEFLDFYLCLQLRPDDLSSE